MNVTAVRANHLPLPIRKSGSTPMRVEKASAIRDLSRDPAEQDRRRQSTASTVRPANLYHCDTAPRDPFRYTGYPNSAFVAQVLGQVMMGDRNAIKTGNEYLPDTHASALLLDRDI